MFVSLSAQIPFSTRNLSLAGWSADFGTFFVKEVDRKRNMSYNIKLCDSVSIRLAKSPGKAFEMIENESCGSL